MTKIACPAGANVGSLLLVDAPVVTRKPESSEFFMQVSYYHLFFSCHHASFLKLLSSGKV